MNLIATHRNITHGDAAAMRLLVAAHGRLPATRAPQWPDTATETESRHREAERLKKARYRARKTEGE